MAAATAPTAEMYKEANKELLPKGVDYNNPHAVVDDMLSLAAGLEQQATAVESGHGAHSNPAFLMRRAADTGKRLAEIVEKLIPRPKKEEKAPEGETGKKGKS